MREALTVSHTYATGHKMSRDKLWTERLTLPIDEKTLQRLDALAKAEGVARLDIIREGILAELKRRERKPKPGPGE